MTTSNQPADVTATAGQTRTAAANPPAEEWAWAPDIMWARADDRGIAVTLHRVGDALRLSAEGRDLDVPGYFNEDDGSDWLAHLGKQSVHMARPMRFGQYLLLGDDGRPNVLLGSGHADFINGGAHKDVMFGREGDDTMFGNDGGDFLYAQNGNDYLSGGNGNDLLFGGAGRDRLYGESGHDRLSGGLGDDHIEGGFGDDVIAGNEGDDVLFGDQGNDIYEFGWGDGHDTIHNFDAHWPEGYLDSDDDRVEFDPGIKSDHLWFSRIGDDLKVRLLGGNDSMLIKHWYSDWRYRIDGFYLDDGRKLTADKTELLVQAMAGLTPPAATDTRLPMDYRSTLVPILAAAWQAA